ncbi:MAG TPA: hypothetical protein VJR04_13235, partial [Terriglobales bacterium]|nr:hypothetical protein [Terriglobales bacterium]
VAYLDDGTMVVVDNARKMIGKNVDIAVTSVLQTTAGKMIFGKFDERAAFHRTQENGPTAQQAANGPRMEPRQSRPQTIVPSTAAAEPQE